MAAHGTGGQRRRCAQDAAKCARLRNELRTSAFRHDVRALRDIRGATIPAMTASASTPPPARRHDPTGTFQTGMLGEYVVGDLLRSDGWNVLGHRVRTRSGELDLVARRGDLVVFGEVKSSRTASVDMARLVDARMRLRLRRAAIAWMAGFPQLQRGVRRYRFDVFLVTTGEDSDAPTLVHLPNAF
jgi:putative endonuclease